MRILVCVHCFLNYCVCPSPFHRNKTDRKKEQEKSKECFPVGRCRMRYVVWISMGYRQIQQQLPFCSVCHSKPNKFIK